MEDEKRREERERRSQNPVPTTMVNENTDNRRFSLHSVDSIISPRDRESSHLSTLNSYSASMPAVADQIRAGAEVNIGYISPWLVQRNIEERVDAKAEQGDQLSGGTNDGGDHTYSSVMQRNTDNFVRVRDTLGDQRSGGTVDDRGNIYSSVMQGNAEDFQRVRHTPDNERSGGGCWSKRDGCSCGYGKGRSSSTAGPSVRDLSSPGESSGMGRAQRDLEMDNYYQASSRLPGNRDPQYHSLAGFPVENRTEHASTNRGSSNLDDVLQRRLTFHPRNEASSQGIRANRFHRLTKYRKKRTIFTAQQLRRLHEEFARDRFVDADRRRSLGQELGLGERQVKVWFQNQRSKARTTQQAAELPQRNRLGERSSGRVGRPASCSNPLTRSVESMVAASPWAQRSQDMLQRTAPPPLPWSMPVMTAVPAGWFGYLPYSGVMPHAFLTAGSGENWLRALSSADTDTDSPTPGPNTDSDSPTPGPSRR